ncbi:MAG: response regulator transcription factor [Moraxellaceae bacterium]
MSEPIARVLVVEDDHSLRQYLAEALTECGYAVVPLENGDEAEAWLETSTADVVLTDLVMPEQDGVALIASIKRRFPSLPVVAMSGRGRTDLTIDSLALVRVLGADATLEKPFGLAELERTIAWVLARH